MPCGDEDLPARRAKSEAAGHAIATVAGRGVRTGDVGAVVRRAAGPDGALVPPRLPLLRLELTFTVEETALVPPFRGAMWRSVLGPALKRIDEGLLPGLSTGVFVQGTLYRTFFETPPPPDATRMRRYNAAPHPYIIDAPGRPSSRPLEPGEEECIGLTLVGRAATAAEAVLAAFDFAARSGFGAPHGFRGKRGRARLSSVRSVWRGPDEESLPVYDDAGYRAIAAEVPPLPATPARVRVLLATPLRLVEEGRLLTPRAFGPSSLLANLVRRVSMLSAFFGNEPLDTDFRRLKELWLGLSAGQPRIAFADQMRWSASQQRELDMGGVVGSFTLDLAGSEALFPYLWLGQWVHAGKGAVMGMGAIRLRPEG